MRSLIFLFGLFYFRFLPLFIFWNICPVFVFSKRNSKLFYLKQAVLVFSLFVSVIVSLVTFLFFPVFLLNIFLLGPNKTVLASLFMFWKIDKTDSKVESAEKMSRNLSLLLSLGDGVKKKMLILLFRTLEILGLILLSIGGIELGNDFQSHVNPDIFDFFFPDLGGNFFWGGLSLFSFSSFFLYFIFGQEDLRSWRNRINKIRNLSDFWERILISKTLMHPYFFLSSKSRVLLQKKKMVFDEKTFRFLNKAIKENLREIPEEWIDD